MLESKSEQLLKTIIELSVADRYNVFSKKQLAAAIPELSGGDGAKLRGLIFELESCGYIDVRYEDDSELCLSATPKGRLFFEKRPMSEIKNNNFALIFEHILRFFEIFAGIIAAMLVLSIAGVRS